MRKAISLALVLLALPAHAADSDRVSFVSEYIRELSRFNEIRVQAAKEAVPKTRERIAACVRNMTTLQLELGDFTGRLASFHLEGQFRPFPGLIAEIFQKQADLYGELEKDCEAILAQNPGTDFGELSARAPKLTAELNFNENKLLKITPAVAMMLIDMKRSSNGMLDHLIITREVRAHMLSDLRERFSNLNAKTANATVGSAWLISVILMNQSYKSADE